MKLIVLNWRKAHWYISKKKRAKSLFVHDVNKVYPNRLPFQLSDTSFLTNDWDRPKSKIWNRINKINKDKKGISAFVLLILSSRNELTTAMMLAIRNVQNASAARRKRRRVEPWLSCDCRTGIGSLTIYVWLGALAKIFVSVILPGIIVSVCVNRCLLTGNLVDGCELGRTCLNTGVVGLYSGVVGSYSGVVGLYSGVVRSYSGVVGLSSDWSLRRNPVDLPNESTDDDDDSGSTDDDSGWDEDDSGWNDDDSCCTNDLGSTDDEN